MTPVVEANGIAKLFGQLLAVDDLTVAVEAGEVLGILGPNGAGKTTAVRMLTTILAPSRGSFAVAGIPHTRPEEIRRRIGVLPESAGYPGGQTGEQYLTYHARLYGHPAPGPGRLPARCSTSSGWRNARDRRSRRTAAGCGSGSASRARSSTTPSPSSWTSPRSASTRPGSGRCCATSARSRGSAGRPCS